MQYGFAVGSGYDPGHELIIDPGLAYSTFLGGASNETGTGIAVDAAGQRLRDRLHPVAELPDDVRRVRPDRLASNSLDVFVTKLNATGTALVYSTFLGGSNFDMGRGLAIDAAGNAYVAGPDDVVELPDDRRRLRSHASTSTTARGAASTRRRVRHQAERRAARRSSTRRSSAGRDIDDAHRHRARRRAATPT